LRPNLISLWTRRRLPRQRLISPTADVGYLWEPSGSGSRKFSSNLRPPTSDRRRARNGVVGKEITCPPERDARAGRFSQMSCGQARRSDQRPLISGSQVRAPKPATDSSLAERPFLRPFLARGGLRIPVSARRYRLQVAFGAPVSGGARSELNAAIGVAAAGAKQRKRRSEAEHVGGSEIDYHLSVVACCCCPVPSLRSIRLRT
jgi:hypothetical protein